MGQWSPLVVAGTMREGAVMADGTESQVSDSSNSSNSSNTDKPEGPCTQYLAADTGRVARIVAALRKAHAEQAAATTPAPVEDHAPAEDHAAAAPAVEQAAVTDTAELPDPPAPRRETSGVRQAKPSVPTLRWNPGARYRASRLADRHAGQAGQAPPNVGPAAPSAPPAGPVPAAPAPAAGPSVHGPVPPPPPPPPLAGRLYRGPAKRTAVFEREIWHPVARSPRGSREVSEALIAAVERYRKGSISTSGLVRAIGSAHAA